MLIADPEAAAEVRRRSPISLVPRLSARGDVIAPMTPAAFINPAVIQRTAALIAAERGDAGRALPLPRGGRDPRRARHPAAALHGRRDARGDPGRLPRADPRAAGRAARAAGVLRRILPSSGFGPSGSRLDEWSWQVAVDARTAAGHHVRVDVDADGHPGYLATARMLGEVGLLLAEDGATPERGGCLTPATALGTAHLDRFERAGVRFSVSS